MSAENKKVSQLVEMTYSEVVSDDLFYIIDTSAKESKKIKSSQLSAWLNSSGSIIAVNSLFADTASFILGSNVYGSVNSSSYSSMSDVAVSASWASRSLNTISSSYTVTASYAQNVVGGGVAESASFASRSFNSTSASIAFTTNTANTSAFLQYLGGNNGTASYAISASRAIFANTASSLDATYGIVPSASFALVAKTVQQPASASYLIYQGAYNGTASYAVTAGGYGSYMNDYGVFLAITQSVTQSILDSVDVLWSLGTPAQTSVDAFGTVNVVYTSSIPLNGQVKLIAQERITGDETELDSSPITVNISPTVGTWGSYDSGTISIPFSLMGQSNLSGTYMIYVTGSSNISIEPTRIVRFNISSKSNFVDVSSDEPLMFSYTPNTLLVDFSSSLGPPSFDKNSGILASGSNNITWLDMNAVNVTSVRYLWTLPNLDGFVNTNGVLTSLGGFPDNISYIDCNTNGMNTISNMSNITSMSYFDCSTNNLISLPSLPQTISYFDCSSTLITSLQNPMPYGLYKFKCNNTQLPSISPTFPNSVISMSFNNNTLLTSFVSTLPTSLLYISCDYSPIGSLSTLPTNVTDVHLFSCSLNIGGMDYICATLVSNGMINGYLDIRGSGTPSPTATTNIGLLQAAGWTVLHD